MELTREYILRLQKNRQGATGGGSGAAGTSGNYVTPAQLESALANKVDVSFFSRLFELYNGDGTTAAKIETNATLPEDTSKLNIKAPFDFWSQRSVSALGKGGSGSSSVFDEAAMWTALGGSIDNKQIALSHLTTALNGYVKGVKVGETTYSPNASGIVDLGKISPDLSGYVTLTTKQEVSGEKTFKGAIAPNGGIVPRATGSVNTHNAADNSKLVIKQASAAEDGTPNNGLVLEWGTSDNWVGQLYFGDNGTQGLYWGGWTYPNSVLTRNEWVKLAFITDTVAAANKLNTGSATYTAWGQTYWSNGVPNSISGRLHMVSSDIYWKENNYGDQFAIAPQFSGTDDSNLLQFQSAVGAQGTTPELVTRMVITGKNGYVGIGTTSPYTNLDVNGGVKATKFYFYKPNAGNDTNAIYLVYDSANGGVHLVGAGFYADTFVSALGKSDDGGASTFDESQMWLALGTNISAKVIPQTHLNLTGYAKTSDLNAYVKKVKLNGTEYSPVNGTVDLGTITVSGYLPLTGGSLSGALNLTYAEENNAVKLRLSADNEGGNIRIVSPAVFKDEDGNQRFWEMDSFDGNLRFYTRSRGQVSMKMGTDGFLTTTGQGKLWGASNDGSGSGLDADMLDGKHLNELFTEFANGTDNKVYITVGGVQKSLAIGSAAKASQLDDTANRKFWNQTYWLNGRPAAADITGDLTGTGKITTSKVTTTWRGGNLGEAIINSSAAAGAYVMLAKMNTTNGVMTHGVHQQRYVLQYTSNTTISGTENKVDRTTVLMDEDGAMNVSGTLTVNGRFIYVNHDGTTKARLYADGEGGNLQLISGQGRLDNGGWEGHFWEMDSFDGNLRFYNYLNKVNNELKDYREVKFYTDGSVKANRFYLYKPQADDTNAVYLVYDSNGGVHLVGAGFYADTFVSALGKSDRGSSSVFDESAMWQALGGSISNTKISNTHLSLGTLTINGEQWNPATSGNKSITIKTGLDTDAGDARYLKLSGGKLTGSLWVGDNIYLFNDPNEGGNIRIVSPNGVKWEMDGYNDEVFRIFNYKDDGVSYNGGITIARNGNLTAKAFKKSGGTSSQFLKADGSVDNNTYLTGISNGMITSAMLAGSIENGKLKNSSVTVNGTSVSLGGSITTTKWGTARTITISDYDGTNTLATSSIDGSANFTLKLPSTIKASLTGNATSATKLNTGVSTYSAWGQTYWSNGVPNSISGRLHMVSSDIYWKENNYGDQFAIAPQFSGTDDSNLLQFQSAVGTQGTTPELVTRMVITGKNGYVGIGTTSPAQKLDVSGNIHLTGDIYLNNTKHVYFRNAANNGDVNVLALDGSNQLFVGGDMTGAATYIRGKQIYLQPGTSSTTALSINASGLVEIVQNAQGLKIGNAYLVWDSANSALKVTGANNAAINFYATGGVSALGMGDGSGGGGVTLNEPLASINTSSLGSPSGHTNSTMVWNGSSWVWSNSQGTTLAAYAVTGYSGSFTTGNFISLTVGNKAVATQEWVMNKYYIGPIAAGSYDFNFTDGITTGGVYQVHSGSATKQSSWPFDYGLVANFVSTNGHLQIAASSDKNDIKIRSYWWTGSSSFGAYPEWKTLLHSGNTYISGQTITINGTSLTVPTGAGGDYLPLSGGTLTGNLHLNFQSINASETNNGISQAHVYPTTFNICDKYGKILTRMEADVESTGDISSYWYVRNYNTSGGQIGQKGIRMRLTKGGVFSYTVDEPDKFREAIGVNLGNYVAKTGDTMTGGLTINHNNGTALSVNGPYSLSGVGTLSGLNLTASVSQGITFKSSSTGRVLLGMDWYTNSAGTLTVSNSTDNSGIFSYGGFKKSGSSDSYVLLGGGGHKKISDFQTTVINNSFGDSGTAGYGITRTLSGKNYFGWQRVAVIQINSAWIDQMLTIHVIQRGNREGDIKIKIGNRGYKDPNIESVIVEGNLMPVRLTRGTFYSDYNAIYYETPGRWELWVEKKEAYDNMSASVHERGKYIETKMTVTLDTAWFDPSVGSTLPAEPKGIDADIYKNSSNVWRIGSASGYTYQYSITGTLTANPSQLYTDGDGTLKIYTALATSSSTYGKETVCLQTAIDGNDPETYGGTSGVSNPARCVLALQPRGGNVGIGTTSPTVKLDVNGVVRATKLQLSHGFYLDWDNSNSNAYSIGEDGSDIYAEGDWYGRWVSSSDVRLKDINQYLDGKLEDIALAPIFSFRWKNKPNKPLELGTSAQYWKEHLPYGVTQAHSGYLALDYGATALAAAVFTARKVVDHELRIKQLQDRVIELENELKQLKAA